MNIVTNTLVNRLVNIGTVFHYFVRIRKIIYHSDQLSLFLSLSCLKMNYGRKDMESVLNILPMTLQFSPIKVARWRGGGAR